MVACEPEILCDEPTSGLDYKKGHAGHELDEITGRRAVQFLWSVIWRLWTLPQIVVAGAWQRVG